MSRPLFVLGNQHPMVLPWELHKSRPGDLRVSEFPLRKRNIAVGRALQYEGWTTNAGEGQFRQCFPLLRVVFPTVLAL